MSEQDAHVGKRGKRLSRIFMNPYANTTVVKLLRKGDRVYVELPEELRDRPLKAIKISSGIFVVATEDALKELIDRQLRYVIRKGIEKKVQGISTKRGEGYWMFSSEEEAAQFSSKHAAQIRRREMLGIKSFDGKYYVVRADVYASVLPRILRALGSGKTADELSAELGLERDLVKAVLELAREEGLVYEAAGGVYKRAE